MQEAQAVAYSPAMVERLRPALAEGFEVVAARIRRGAVQLYQIGDVLAAVSVDAGAFVVNAVAGQGLAQAMPELYRLGQESGQPWIRFHSRWPGLAEMAADYNPVLNGRDESGRFVYLVRVE